MSYGDGAVLRRYKKKYPVAGTGIKFDDNSLSFKGVSDKRNETEWAFDKMMLRKAKRAAGKKRSKG